VRRAIALAIDRRALVHALWRDLGEVSDTILAPGHWARNDALPPLPYDPGAARALLEEAGYHDPDGDGPEPRLSLTLKVSTLEASVLQATAIQAMLAQAGIRLEVRAYEFASFYEDIRKGNFQMFSLVRTAATEPNLYRLILHSASIPPAGQNRGRYRNAEFDALIDRAATLSDRAERRPLYLRTQEILAEDLPYLVLQIKNNVAVMPRRLGGYRNWSSGEFTALRSLRWEAP
jgi:peptide/nickel transport system substrate-binding protein